MIKFSEIDIGMQFSYSQTITDADIKAFSGVSGDKNPVHMDDEYAENSRFKKRIAHGLMLASYFSAIFGTKFPGPGCVYVSQSLNFLRPVYIGSTVKAIVTVTAVNETKRRVFFETLCKVKKSNVIVGQAEIYIPL